MSTAQYMKTMGDAVRYGVFQVVSIVTTTGYATADYEKWPAMSQFILLLCMFLGLRPVPPVAG